MKINEIFYSIQGEGFWHGTPMVFIRFSGCNLACSFCDTTHQSYKSFSNDEILTEIRKYPSAHVCLTGGEPSLQINQEFIDLLKASGLIIHIETNGTKELPQNIDWITVSPKTESIAIKKAEEIKVIFQGQNVEKWKNFDAVKHYLQPETTGDKRINRLNIRKVIKYIKDNPTWKLSIQTQKMLNIR